MDLSLDENQEMLRQMTREFARDVLAPAAAEWDRAGAVPDAIWQQLGGLGLLGVCVAESHGGAGMDLVSLATAIEELAAGEAGLATVVLVHNALCAAHIARAGSVAQMERWLPGLASGQQLGTWAGGFSDAGRLTAGAVRSGKGWRLDGSLAGVAAVERADVAVVMAATGPGMATAFVLERGEWGMVAGETLGTTSAGIGELVLDGVEVGDDRRLGAVDGALADEAAVMDRARVGRAALAVGVGRAAFEAGCLYAGERKQFGRPLTDFQAIAWMIADGATELDAARLLYRQAASRVDEGQPASAEAAMARVFASERAREACDRALQMHGGYGYTRDYPVERHWRDAHALMVGEGTDNALQRLLIARALIAEVQ